MATASGYILRLPPDRVSAFLEFVEAEERFAQPVEEFQHSRNLPLVCLVIEKTSISHIALGRRGNRAGTGLRRLNLSDIERLPKPLDIDAIINALPPRNKAHVKRRFRNGGLLASRSFSAVVEAIRAVQEQSIPLIERFSVARAERIRRYSPEVRTNLAYQKEALLTALFIAKMSRVSIQAWSPSEEAPSSFLDGLPDTRLREDQMIVNDMHKIPGFSLERITVTGAAVFKSPKARLTVILANRLPLESQTGTDLIYFNETFQSFVMVQYKAMTSEPDDNGMNQPGFRLSDRNLPGEISRMESTLSVLKACPPSTSHSGFRLNDNPFYLKLCSRVVFNPDDVSLVPGMYIPLDYWKLLEQSDDLAGSRGGKRVTYENVGRYLDNSEFTTFVANAWIGTTPSQSELLQELIRQVIQSGRAVAIAVKSRAEQMPFGTEIPEVNTVNDLL